MCGPSLTFEVVRLCVGALVRRALWQHCVAAKAAATRRGNAASLVKVVTMEGTGTGTGAHAAVENTVGMNPTKRKLSKKERKSLKRQRARTLPVPASTTAAETQATTSAGRKGKGKGKGKEKAPMAADPTGTTMATTTTTANPAVTSSGSSGAAKRRRKKEVAASTLTANQATTAVGEGGLVNTNKKKPKTIKKDKKDKKGKKDKKLEAPKTATSDAANTDADTDAATDAATGAAFRAEHGIRVEGEGLDSELRRTGLPYSPPAPTTSLAEAPFHPALAAVLLTSGFTVCHCFACLHLVAWVVGRGPWAVVWAVVRAFTCSVLQCLFRRCAALILEALAGARSNMAEHGC